MNAVVVSFCQHSDSSHRAIADSLRNEGLKVETSAGDTDQPYIVLFDRTDETIRARIQTIARFGLRRVLCLCTTPSLKEEDYWGLLAAAPPMLSCGQAMDRPVASSRTASSGGSRSMRSWTRQ